MEDKAFNMKLKAVGSSETLMSFHQATRCQIPQQCNPPCPSYFARFQ